jgi:hypothetical protein
MRTTSLVARATASSSSPTMSPTSTIFGSAAALALGGVAHRLQVAVVEVLQAGQDRAARRCSANMKFLISTIEGTASSGCRSTRGHTVRTWRGHAVDGPARARDEPVAALLLHAGQAGEELVGDVLAQASLRKSRPGISMRSLRSSLRPRGVEVAQLEGATSRRGSCRGCGRGG